MIPAQRSVVFAGIGKMGLPMAAHLLWQVTTLKTDGANALILFRANRFAGLLLFAACVVVGAS